MVLAALACASVFGIYHTVRQGETLYSISRAYNVPVDTLKRVNYLRDPAFLIPGEKLFIPGADDRRDGHPKAKPAPLEKQAPPAREKRAALLGKPTQGSEQRPEGSLDFIWPTDGVLSSGFGDRWGRKHNGIDLTAPEGTPILAAADGRVAYAATDQRGYGNLVILEHENGFITIYAHNRENLVKEGDEVKRGTLIARVGKSGNATGNHLHFEIRQHRVAVDPIKYLP